MFLQKEREHFVKKWISTECDRNLEEFERDLKGIGIPPNNSITVIIFRIKMGESFVLEIYSQVYALFSQNSTVIAFNDYDFVLLTNELINDEFMEKIDQVCYRIRNNTDQLVSCGIGETCVDNINVRRSFLSAKKAIELSRYWQSPIKYCDNITDIALNTISDRMKIECIKNVFKSYDNAAIQSTGFFIIRYLEMNGSIDRIAKEDFVHKNTVQYRILKIKNDLGLDMRNIGDFLKLYIATQCFFSIKTKNMEDLWP